MEIQRKKYSAYQHSSPIALAPALSAASSSPTCTALLASTPMLSDKQKTTTFISFIEKFHDLSQMRFDFIPNAILNISGAGFSYPTSDDTTMASNLESSRSVNI
jgi:hypothetical protein